ncbi:MAG: YggS family pyridoxal phosphate-dependent enzyme [Prolixibacteraceae bacterium]|jgi:pyridoxal phosphate enzyme (YggS family)|nr:YggS family pyridoxal phosphate-dependent enzyme [Prolixibacteraceae bacterium]
MSITENLNKIRSSLPSKVKLVAVSKTKPNEAIQEAYETGQRIFGENKVQDLVQKYETLPKDIQWHFIGHLQSNKVKYIAPFISLLHAVDSMKLLETINKEAAKHNRVIDCLLQFHIAQEDSKFGLKMVEAEQILESDKFSTLKNIRIIGVMGMATYTNNVEQVSNEFKRLSTIFQHLKAKYFNEDQAFSEISMGMSNDYTIAVKHGSTMVRIGSTIFGARVY